MVKVIPDCIRLTDYRSRIMDRRKIQINIFMVDFTWNSPSSHVSTFNLSFLSSTINICPSTGPVQHTPAKGAHDKAGKDDEKNTRIWFCWAHVVLCCVSSQCGYCYYCDHTVNMSTLKTRIVSDFHWTLEFWEMDFGVLQSGLWERSRCLSSCFTFRSFLSFSFILN